MGKKAPPLPDLEAMAALTQRIETAATEAPELACMELDEVLRFIKDKRAIFAGSFDGTPAIARFYFDAPRAYAKRDWDELQRTRAYMSEGPFRVNAPLYHLPDLGLIVVQRETGQPMLERVWQAEIDKRFNMMPGAVHWLRHYTQPMERRAPMRAASWIAKADKRLGKNASARLRPLMRNVRAELERLLPAMDGHAWRVSISHGDFHPNNLLVKGDILTGIDTGGSAKLPIYKDMARFLTHMGRRGLHPSGEVRFGVDRGTFDLFAQVFDLDEAEREIWLPFMIGIEALLRSETPDLTRSRLRRAQRFYEALVEDLAAIDSPPRT
ncbi:MAG: phosphotransferase [Pseudomonadota bacterium]